jgi:hypothetical protein
MKVSYANGDVFSASDINDTNGTINLLTSTTLSIAGGKNFLINGGFDFWQRSTSASTSTGTYPAADRYWAYTNSGSATMARESTVIPAGARYSAKITATGAGTQVFFAQAIETSMCAPFIGKTVTVSGQLAASTSTAHTLLVQYSTTVDDSNSGSWTSITAATTSGSLTPTSTTFVSFANTYAIPSTAKTVRVGLQPTGTVANAVALYYGNLQLELGSTATTFSRAGGQIQGELAACQRYFEFIGGKASGYPIIGGYATAGISAYFPIAFKASKRISPTVTKVGTWSVGNTGQPSPNYIGVDGFSSLQTATATGAFYTYPDSTDDGFNCDAEL